MKVLDLFSGIGGFSLGLERAGFETVAFCEIDPFCQKVLKKHWPDVPIYTDIKELRGDEIEADVITAGFPCQDLSIAGKQAGIDGERSGLWSEVVRLLGEIRPMFAVMENVTALLSGDRGRWFGRVLGDLAQVGYDCEWHCIPASAVGSIQNRDRAWIIAYPCENREQGLLTSEHISQARQRRESSQAHLQSIFSAPLQPGDSYPKPLLCGVDRRIPHRLDRVGACGNSVDPAIPEIIGRAIMEAEA